MIEFTFIPPYGSIQNLRGRVGCVVPVDHKVAVYINVGGGFWTKPYWSAPLTTINLDGTWVTDITTGGDDPLARQIAAFLVPNGYDPPSMGGGTILPPNLFANALAYLIVDRTPARTLSFAGQSWYVKGTETMVSPGPCTYSDRPEDVWTDGSGRLHLTLTSRNGRWYCTEVFTSAVFGYGTYTFTLASPVNQLDTNVVLGLFTYDDTSPAYSHRELDVELAQWRVAGGPNAQYVLQPYGNPGHRYQFYWTEPGPRSIHAFTWSPGRVQYVSYAGDSTLLQSYTYAGSDVPPPGQGNARINLWLYQYYPPAAR